MDILRFLDEQGIAYERCDHPAVFTVEEADRLVPPLVGTKTKNLFLRDARGRRHFLVVLPSEKTADLKALAPLLGQKKLSFASPERLRRHLGIEPGAVSILGIVNDRENLVQVVVDPAVWNAGALQCHPLVNTATLVISGEGIRRFLEATGHAPRVLEVPARA
jgi:Ala-tRNA(Pro) deacylase